VFARNPEPEIPMTKFFRVEADWGAGYVFEAETWDRIGYLAVADRLWKDGAKGVRIVECELVGGN
jgi:hypothetical protein